MAVSFLAIAAGAALGAAVLLDYQYGAFGLLFWALTWAWCLLSRQPAARDLRLWAAMIGVFMAIAGPLLGPALIAMSGGEDPTAGNNTDAAFYSADLIGFVVPSRAHWGQELDPLFAGAGFQGIGGVEGVTFLGWTALGLAGVALVKAFAIRRGLRPAFGATFWGATLGLFLLLALGPQLHIGGSSHARIA